MSDDHHRRSASPRRAALAGLVSIACALGLAGVAGAQDGDRPAAPAPKRSGFYLQQVAAIGPAVFSPDGRWIAVREDGGAIAVIERAAAERDPKGYEPHRIAGGLGDVANWNDWRRRLAGPGIAFAAAADGGGAVELIAEGGEGLIHATVSGAGVDLDDLAAPAGAIPILTGRGGRWPVLVPVDADGDDGWRKPALWVVGAAEWPEKAPRVRPKTLRWTDDGAHLVATLADGSLARIDAGTGALETLVARAAVEKAVGKPIERVVLRAFGPDGKLFVAGVRPYPEDMRGRSGTYVPAGDEAPTRGRNPGSAEPGPGMPQYLYVADGETLTLIKQVSLARHLDTLLVAPSRALDRFAFLQVANDGGAGSGVPTIWAGSINAAGKLTEKELGRVVDEGLEAPRFRALATSADGSGAILLMEASREKELRLDDPAVKKLLGGAPKEMAAPLLSQAYGRGGARITDDAVILSFASWGLYALDAGEPGLRKLGLFGEGIARFAGETGLPGEAKDIVYDATSGWLVATVRHGSFDSKAQGMLLLELKAP